MLSTPSTIDQYIELISKTATTSFKLSIFIGGICITMYSISINHFPQDLSIGDGLFFSIVAWIFGTIYLCTIGLLLLSSRVILNLLYYIAKKIKNKNKNEFLDTPREIEPYHWMSTIIAISVSIYFIAQNEWIKFIAILGCAVFIRTMFDLYRRCEENVNKIEATIKRTPLKDTVSLNNHNAKIKQARKHKAIYIIIILIAPLSIGILATNLLNSTMQIIHTRVESAKIQIKEPYSQLIPESLKSTSSRQIIDYTAFENITILFKGLGKFTVISFKDGDNIKELEIPNEFLIIEKTQASIKKQGNVPATKASSN